MVLTRWTWVRRPAITAVGGVVALTACGEAGTTDTTAGYVVATTSIWADVVGRVVCDGAFEVRTLIPAGGDAHAYEPSLRDRETLDGAALVVANGLDLEELLADTLDQVAASGTPVFEVGEHVDTIPAGAATDDEHTDEHADETVPDADHGHDGADPHVWFDPTRVAAALPALGDAVVAAGADRATTQACVDAAVAELTALDAEIAGTLAAVPPDRRLLVTNHDALGYLADRYDFTVLGTVLPSSSTLTGASPGQLEDLGAAIEEAGVPAIFTEALGTDTDAVALADRLGVEVVELATDTLGDDGSDTATYPDLLRTDAARIAAALGA